MGAHHPLPDNHIPSDKYTETLHHVHQEATVIARKLSELYGLIRDRTTPNAGFLSDKKSLTEWQREIHELAVDKGWWPSVDTITTPVIVEKLCLIHSEVSEALEEIRNEGAFLNLEYDNDGKPVGFPIELADAIIRILDLCGALNIDIERAIRAKHEYNKTRSHRHGGKAL